MKIPDDIKKGLKYCGAMYEWDGSCTGCPYERNDGECEGSMETDALAYIQQLEDAIDKTTQLMRSATEVIKKSQEQLESTYSQVKKALCGKENVSWVEVLEAADQLKSRLAQVERERDAAVADILRVLHTKGTIDAECLICDMEKPDCHWECEKAKWRGVCPENTKEE